MWLCSSQATDLERPRKSRIYGAVFVTDVLRTQDCQCHSIYGRFKDIPQFQSSAEFAYQMNIPGESWARGELVTPIEVPEGDVSRWEGVWIPHDTSTVYDDLKRAQFVE